MPGRVGSMAVMGVVAVIAVLAAGCSGGNDYYQRAPYTQSGRIDSSLGSAERALAGQLARGDTTAILAGRTAPPWTQRMRVFLHSYADHPARVLRMTSGDDATAEERLLISCPHGIEQQVGLAWAWFDGAWRAWPEYHLFPITRCGAGPPTPALPGVAVQGLRRTTVSRVRPVTSTGALAPGYTVVAIRHSSQCETYSQIGPADRCHAGHVIEDPCWRAYQHGHGPYDGDYCLAAPWQRQVMHLTGKPPRDEPDEGGPTLWGLQVVNGARCAFVTGSAGVYHGYRLDFACGAHRWLAGHPDRSAPTWSITEVTGRGTHRARTVHIVHAWLALSNAEN